MTYGTIVLDLLDIQSEDARNKVNWKLFHRLLNFQNIMDILFNNGVIIVIGDPRFSIPSPTSKEDEKSVNTIGGQKRFIQKEDAAFSSLLSTLY